MRRPWYDAGGRRVPVLVGYGPPRPGFDHCAPLVAGDAGRRLEILAGLERTHLPFHFAALNLFVRHAKSVSPSVGTLRRAGGDVLSSTRGRVLVALGAGVRRAFRLEHVSWCERVDLPEHEVYVLPHPSPRNRWYNAPQNVASAKRVLCEARERALQYEHVPVW